ncbi:ABC transporter substrate-binding protein [Pseudactinotalea sp.]|uniref:ABC transporter substrate-binding protein n=1 Tax=Pseudactinotalea sp. TaxID=1926260 RepID=UPI003B3A9DD9
MDNRSLLSTPITRRSALLTALGLGAAGALTACGGGSGDSDAPVVFGIFGSADKLEIRKNAIDAFIAAHPDNPVEYLGVPSDAWPDKIATMVASGNAPDVITLAGGEVFTYASRGTLEPLDAVEGFEPGNFTDAILDLGRAEDGTLYAAPIAASTQALGMNVSLLDRLDVAPPPEVWAFEEFADYCREVYDASDGTVCGTQDWAQSLGWWQVWMRANGSALFGDGAINASVDDIAAWLHMWEELRQEGVSVPIDVSAQWTPGSWPNSPMVKGLAVFSNIAVQDLESGYQSLMEDELTLTPPPSAEPGGSKGLYTAPSSCVTLNARSDKKERALEVLNWFVSAPESAQILGLISGPPAADTALAAVLEMEDLSQLQATVLSYTQEAFADIEPTPPAEIKGGIAAVTDLARRVNEEVGFGRMSASEAAEQFVTEANQTLSTAS